MTHPVSPSSRTAQPAATRPALRAALSIGLTAALAVAGTAGAASAVASPGHSGGGASGHASGNGHSSNNGHASGNGQSSGNSADNGHRSPGSSHGQATSSARTANPSSLHRDSASRGHSTQGAHSSPSSRRHHDPRGNNGTIKIDGVAYDSHVDNEPHPGCAFRVTFFGFDAGQTADITVTGIAPTGGGTLLAEHAVPTSDDAAGGAGHDVDGATRVYTADDLGLASVTPHPKQGYHLKVTVDSLEAPGGAKQKVLWLAPCQQPMPQVAASDVGTPASSGSTGVAPATAGDTGATPGAEVAGVQAAAPADRSPQAADQVLGASYVAPAGRAATPAPARTSVLSQAASALPAVAGTGAAVASLAFTGASGVVLLLSLGLGAVAAGAALTMASRRRVVSRA